MDSKPELMTRKPDWLKISLPQGKQYLDVREIIARKGLHTICVSGKCPNLSECWGRGTASFMILGDVCTRACRFCSVKTGSPQGIVDWNEPDRLAESIEKMNLKHCVITSVDRDDLPDLGAEFWATTIRRVKERNPDVTLETLIPDFNGIEELIYKVIDTGPEIISHNMETVRRLTPKVRSRAKYDVSLKTIETIAKSGKAKPKSGIMVGLGETEEEILETMDDLINVGCQVLTIGQYLQPTRKHLTVKEFVTPEQFRKYKVIGLEKGFKFVESGPLVRSSYHAEKHV
ncbi:lipoic acid synthetase [Porphyromonadaceae bacterium NLAE-zl-C104]|uniref:lipoyl synthase n=1 Tax=Proteiniphilum TaxID=294702 RepID=UPI0008981A26|nr:MULTISPECIES: lipoyl synthase [Proteiniphilum]MDY9917729.1 lipoyl synthase [Proteiniphilum sp.]SEA22729.1 lipoic acid synthetase [Porphyromonadaceae bacterium KH3R12]SFS81236.1 lipoic acid synthetase [Porphyromonadaceae bacterium NLAE-zl-C104]